jgi:uncharacterized protein YutE (UPF0331/DUF86 family)
MVDEGRAARLLRGVADRIHRLNEAADHRDDDPSSLWLDGVKYLFVTAIEGCVDVAHHIASSESWRAPDNNAGAIRLLGERNVIDADVTVSVARSVGFRNVLVHQYAEVDDAIVIDALDRLDDLRAYVSQVSAWMLNQSPNGE